MYLLNSAKQTRLRKNSYVRRAYRPNKVASQDRDNEVKGKLKTAVM